MADFNHELLEVADINFAFVPVDTSIGANNGQWISMLGVSRMVCLVAHAVGTVGDDAVLTMKQASDIAGTGSKTLIFTRFRTKIGTVLTTPRWVIQAQAAIGTAVIANAVGPALIAVEILPTDLDMAGGFNHIQMSVPKIGNNAQLGLGLYISYGIRYAQSIPLTLNT